MHEVSVRGIRDVFEWDPPNNQQLMILALEESRRRNERGEPDDRREVYELFAEFKV